MPFTGSLSPLQVFQMEDVTILPIVEKEDDIRHLLFRKNMVELQNLDVTIYDTESYYAEQQAPTDLVSYIPGDQMYIEVLKHTYEEREYEYDVIGEEVPQFNMAWRNAISFIGRLIINGKIKYKGLIILQFDGVKHHILLQKPKQVNFGTFNQQDPTSLSYNALDPSPFVFEDLLGNDAPFIFPTILGVIPYNIPFNLRNPGGIIKFAKTFSSFDKHQLMFLRPYFAIPTIPQLTLLNAATGSFRLILERQMYANGPIERYVLSQNFTASGDPIIDWNNNDLSAFLYKIYDLTRSHNQAIRYRLITEIIDGYTLTPSEAHASLIKTGVNDITDSFQVLLNMNETNPGQDYLRYRIRFSWSNPINAAGVEYYNVNLTIERSRLVSEDDEEPIYEKVEVSNNTTWDSNDQRTTIQIITNFEGINFIVDVATKSGSVYILNAYQGEIHLDVSALIKHRHTSTGTTQPIIVRGERLVDPNEMLKLHNLKNATYLTGYSRFILKYGPHTGSNILQFLAYDDDSFAPFPFGGLDFDSEIIHIHIHRGNIYVFTNGGLWILHSILDFVNLQKTFAYPNIKLSPAEKSTVVSFGNEVFYISQNQGYVIRTNVNVESQDDVYVMPVTGPINNILKNPNHFIKQRLEEGYGKVIDSFVDVKVNYYTKAINNEVYIYASYFVKDGMGRKENIMLTFIYNRDNRRWTMYDTVVGSYPIESFISGWAKGFDLVLKNDNENPYITYSSYLQYLPNNNENMVIGDIQVVKDKQFVELKRENALPIYDIKSISAMFDTGSLGFSSMHVKKIRRIHTTLSDLKGESFKFYVVPYIDNLDYQNRLYVDIITDGNNQYVPDYLENVNELGFSSIIPVIESQNMKQEGFRVTLASLQTTKKLTMITQLNARGKLPGFRIYFFVKDKMKIGEYGIVYRQQKAR